MVLQRNTNKKTLISKHRNNVTWQGERMEKRETRIMKLTQVRTPPKVTQPVTKQEPYPVSRNITVLSLTWSFCLFLFTEASGRVFLEACIFERDL